MHITKIQNFTNTKGLTPTKVQRQDKSQHNLLQNTPTISNISFGNIYSRSRRVPDIEHSDYLAMSPITKQRYRKRYQNFEKTINVGELYDSQITKLPLQTEKLMDDFIKTVKIYSQYKDQPIICLGRSPKWFLNASLWMEGGINNYTFVAFSGSWYNDNRIFGMRRSNSKAPTQEEVTAYRKYLKRINATPETIVNHWRETGEKTIITDYITTGKGVCSFLEIMSDYADEKGILEDFSKAIEIIGIGSLEHQDRISDDEDLVSEPIVPLPNILKPYFQNIKQKFYNMEYNMFNEMLIYTNTNECRSTYYPHEAWTVYKPDQFKTGLIKDMKKVHEMVKTLGSKKSMTSFTIAMRDFRNLLNFRILDGLEQRGLLRSNIKFRI